MIMKKRTGLIAITIVVVGIAITISLTQVMVNLFFDYLNWFADNETFGVVIFLSLYLVFGIIALPASFHKYLAGVIYGFGPGIIIAWIGSMIGAIAPFFLGKRWMNPYARRTLESYPSLKGLEDEMTKQGVKVVALTRASLVIPYGVLNYAYGATKVKFKDFIIGNFAMIIPSIMYAWWGSQTIVTSDGIEATAKTPFDFVIVGLSVIITIVLIVKGKQIMDNLEREAEMVQ
tara:strand:+ start:396 stop:1091 length:696 start_codon:yes stop_codon:yes gene_type:complete